MQGSIQYYYYWLFTAVRNIKIALVHQCFQIGQRTLVK